MPFNVCALALWLQASESTGSGQEYFLPYLDQRSFPSSAAGLAKYVISQDTGTPQDAKDFQRDQAGRRSVHEAAKPDHSGLSPASGHHYLPGLLAG